MGICQEKILLDQIVLSDNDVILDFGGDKNPLPVPERSGRFTTDSLPICDTIKEGERIAVPDNLIAGADHAKRFSAVGPAGGKMARYLGELIVKDRHILLNGLANLTGEKRRFNYLVIQPCELDRLCA